MKVAHVIVQGYCVKLLLIRVSSGTLPLRRTHIVTDYLIVENGFDVSKETLNTLALCRHIMVQ
jgi:hypothetical protein